mmetsp:Transcript_28708/g.39403  ORF Transcript_28708/g.39403 Transcript_28708/m.39403 type:complete len:1855 (+) Transcript_28708:3-5567(+)
MQTAYQAAIPSLEIMGTEDNHGLMKLAGAVIEMRKTLATGDLRAVMNVIISNEAVLNGYPVVADEVFRLRIELENQDASKLIELGLKNGRYLDVVSVAKMVQKFDRSKGDVHVEARIHDIPFDAIRNRRSVYLADIASRYSEEIVSANELNTLPDILGIESTGKRISTHKRRNTVHFLSQVTSSLSILSRSVAVATKIVIKSAITQYFLEAAFVILKLRECIISNRWDEVRDIVMRADHDLPATATEEINAVKEGLIYQSCIGILAKALVADGIIGLPHNINCTQVSTRALDRAIEMCANMRLQDISANIMMELGVRLRDVRHTFVLFFERAHKTESWQQSDKSKEFDIEELQQSLDQSVQHFFSYYDEVTGVLKATFQIVENVPMSLHTSDSMQYSTVTNTTECSSTSLFSGDAAATVDWTYELWDSVCCAFEEVRRVRGFLRFSTVHQAIVTSIEMFPDSLLSMSEWRSTSQDGAQRLEYDETSKMSMQGLESQSDDAQTDSSYLAVEKEFFDIDKVFEEAVEFANEVQNDDFHLRILQRAISVAQEYMDQVHEQQRPEEIVTLSDAMKALLAFRFLLASRAAAEDFVQLSNTVKRQLESGFLSTSFGKNELHTYLSIADRFVELKSQIVNALSNGRVSGHVDSILSSNIICSDVELALDACDKFVHHHGEVMSLGLQKYLYEASLILKLRTAVTTGNWTNVNELIAQHNNSIACSQILTVAGKEFEFIYLANEFKAFKSSLFCMVVEFESFNCREYNFNSKEIELQILLDHFNTFISFASFRSPLLYERGKSISDSFITDPLFLSFKVVLRLLVAAVRRKQWYDKKKLHNNPEQLVSTNVDPFLFVFFGLADADYFGNDKKSSDDLKCGREMTLRDESVMSVLVSIDFEKFPNNIQIFLRKIRNALIDKYIHDDLNYYLVRGRATYDAKSGNVLVSELFCKFLELVLVDSEKAMILAGKLSISFSWSTRTTQLLKVAQLLHQCRYALISNDAEKLIDSLKSNTILQNTYPSFVNGFHLFRNVPHNSDKAHDVSLPLLSNSMDGNNVGREISLQSTFDQREEIELFQSHAAAVVTEHYLANVIHLIIDMAKSDVSDYSTLDSNKDIMDLMNWVSTLNCKDSFFSSRLQYHEEMLLVSNEYSACLQSALLGDGIKFRRQLHELLNVTKCSPTFSRICSEQNENLLWAAMEAICSRRCVHPFDSKVGIMVGSITVVEQHDFMTEMLDLLRILKSASMSNTADSTLLSYERHILQRHLAWKLKSKNHISVSMELFSKLESLLKKVKLDDIVKEPLWVACLATIVHSLRHARLEEAFESSRNELSITASDSDRMESKIATTTSLLSKKSIPLSAELAYFLQRLNVVGSRSTELSDASTHGRPIDSNFNPVPLLLLVETLRGQETILKRFRHKMDTLISTRDALVTVESIANNPSTDDADESNVFASVNWESDKISTEILCKMLFLLSTNSDKLSRFPVGVVERAKLHLMPKSPTLNYSYNEQRSQTPLRRFQETRNALSPQKGFGSAVLRFGPDELFPNPGVGQYNIDPPPDENNNYRSSLLSTSPSLSQKGFGTSFLSKTPQITPFVDRKVPGPASYDIKTFSLVSNHNTGKNAFTPSKKGRVPWNEPNPYPGPSDYYINWDPGNSPFMERKKSSTFCSTTARDSFFDKQSPAPGPATYNIGVSSLSGNHDMVWSRKSIDRFDHIGKDNEVPAPTRYFDDRHDYIIEKSHSSLRAVGTNNFSGKSLGKQNEKPIVAMHTFGADKDRFKNSIFGRLDLAAEIPAPGCYDDIFRYSINKGRGRTAPTALLKGTGAANRSPSPPAATKVESGKGLRVHRIPEKSRNKNGNLQAQSDYY